MEHLTSSYLSFARSVSFVSALLCSFVHCQFALNLNFSDKKTCEKVPQRALVQASSIEIEVYNKNINYVTMQVSANGTAPPV